jgi:hypothetical protein
MWRPKLLRYLLHEDLFLFWPGLFFTVLGLLLRARGVTHFYEHGGRLTGEPAMLFGVGGLFTGLGLLRLVLFRIERARQAKKARRGTNGPHRRRPDA